MGKNTMSVKIIAEIANAHQGNYKEALKLGLAAYGANADAVKYQIYFAEEFLSTDHPRYKHFKKQSFTKKQWLQIFKKLKNHKLTKKIYADVFGLKALKFAIKSNLDGIKIHSSDLSNIKLLKYLKKYKKRIFISCGGSSVIEIRSALEIIRSKNVVLLHGFQNYPTSIEDVNFKKLKQIKNFFGNKVDYGYQDHTSGASVYSLYLPLISIGIGVNFIEKHITFNRKKKGVDYFSSVEPAEFKKFVRIFNKCLTTLNKPGEWYSKSEIKYREDVKKNWVAKKNLREGNILKLNDFEMLRHPEKKINVLNIEKYLKRKITTPIKSGSIITKKNFKNKICLTIVARSKSKRLKNKAILKIGDSCVLDHLFKRIKMLKNIDHIIFCTTKDKSDDILVRLAKKNNINCFRGSTLNVLERMIKPLKKINPDVVVRITGDDILIDNDYFQKNLNHFLDNNYDYVDHKKMLSGAETEIFDFQVLNYIYNNFNNLDGTEYLTNYVRDNKNLFSIGSSPVEDKHKTNYSMTIDTKQDYDYVKKFLQEYYLKNKNFYNYNIDDLIDFCKKKKKKKNKQKQFLEIDTRPKHQIN